MTLKTVRRLVVKSDEPTLVQKRILDPRTRELRLRATGYGMAAVQVGYQYSLDVTAAWPSFVVNPQVFKPSTANHMQFTVCVNYIEGGNRHGRTFPYYFLYFLQVRSGGNGLGWVDLDMGSSPGWWATTLATYCQGSMLHVGT